MNLDEMKHQAACRAVRLLGRLLIRWSGHPILRGTQTGVAVMSAGQQLSADETTT